MPVEDVVFCIVMFGYFGISAGVFYFWRWFK